MNTPGLHLAYLVHDLNDPAVARRLVMLRPHLASAVVIGFHRGAAAPASLAGWPVVALGRTADARLGQRVLAVLRAGASLARLRPHLAGATVIMARQLEMLALAAAARRRYAPAATLAYECLDIHRLMTTPGPLGGLLRWLETRLLRRTDVVVTSAPDFVSQHLAPLHGTALPPVCLVENKVQQAELAAPPSQASHPAAPPWRIGWYGMLRCRRSLLLLAELTRQLPGLVAVDLRGRPALAAIPDFHALVAAAPGLHFHGGYNRTYDLPALYQAVHFNWTLDFYEAGANSAWLLPNRLYEGGLYGAVPLALASVATGRWLARHQAGVLLAEPLETSLPGYFATLTPATYAQAAQAMAALPATTWLDSGADAARLAAALQLHR